MPPSIRTATLADLTAINDIYNYYVLHSTATYQTEPEVFEARLAWYSHHGNQHPVTVAEMDGVVVGWGSLSPYHARSAYTRTVENSVYIHHEYHRRGIGKCILLDLLERAAGLGHHVIIAGIDGEQSASIGLHQALGFAPVGHLREVGFKFGRWLDVHYLQKTI